MKMERTDIAMLAAQTWVNRHRTGPLSLERPDQLERRQKAVDVLGRDATGRARLVLEHTLVPSFPDQRTQQIAMVQMFEPVERTFVGSLTGPGNYVLSVVPGSAMGLKRKQDRIRAWVSEWIRQTAPALAIGNQYTARAHSKAATVPGTDMEITLRRWPGRDGQFGIRFDAPNSLDPLRQSVARAITAKCPKLAAARAANPSALSLLVLEIADIALGNLDHLEQSLQAEAEAMAAHMPNDIWLVDSTDDPPTLLIAKERGPLGHVDGERYVPYALRRQAPPST